MKSLNVAIIGCGKIGEKHAFILKSKKIKQLNLIAVCDINKDKAKKFGLKFNVNFFDNLETLLESTKVTFTTDSNVEKKMLYDASGDSFNFDSDVHAPNIDTLLSEIAALKATVHAISHVKITLR